MRPKVQRTLIPLALDAAYRSWVADCQWADDSEDLKGLSDDQIGRGVQKHYDGGWAGFVEDGNYSK